MSLEQLKAFLENVTLDTKLQEQINAAKSLKDVLAIAKEYGHAFNPGSCSELARSDLEVISDGHKGIRPVMAKAGCMPWIGS